MINYNQKQISTGQQGPEILTELKEFRIIKWPGGKEQLQRKTYNPERKEVAYQNITISDRGDAVLIRELLRLHYHID